MPTRKERYFVLGRSSLSYYKPTKDGDVELKGVLELKASDVISPMPHSDVWLRVRQNEGPGGRSYKLDLKASSLQERREWIEALRKACRGELLLRQRTLQRDIRLLHARTSQRGHNGKDMAEFMSSPVSPVSASTPRVDLRASFQVFHEMVLLQKLVNTIKSSWGPPSQWTMPQYQELVQGISLAQEKSGTTDFQQDSVLAEAFRLRYQFEEIPENQRKLSRDDDALGNARNSAQLKTRELSPPPTPHKSPKVRCPSFHSYYSTFENLSDRAGVTVKPVRAENDGVKVLTPRSATLAKYAHLYLLDDIRAKQPWSLDRAEGDDLTERRRSNAVPITLSEAEIASILADRFENDRIYSYINHHTMVVLNPYRLLQTARFTSIYDEQVVLTYAETADAEATLAPHPFAVAKQSLVRLFFDRESVMLTTPQETTNNVAIANHGQSIFLCGESGSGKTELAKDLVKYLVLVAQPALSQDSEHVSTSVHQPKIKLFTSSTKSTIQMRAEEARTIALLEAKGVESYEIVLLDLHPDRWNEMTAVSHSKRLPQVHVDGLFFGFYEELEHLEDEEQLRMYFKNPHAAKKLSTVLDSNILLEAFGHATTSMNLNSSRFGKVTTLQISFGLHPWEFQVCGCHIAPFLLEKTRVTSEKRQQQGDDGDMNFHVLYAMVGGVNTLSFMRLLAKELRLDGTDCSTFAYLGHSEHKLAEFIGKEDTLKKDVERWQQIIDGLDELNISAGHQKTIFKVLSAVLWLGNIDLSYTESRELQMSGTGAKDVPQRVAELLGLESVKTLEQMLMTRSVTMHSTGEKFEVSLERGQAIHVRNALARLLYQLVFDYVVAAMNKATKMGDTSTEIGVTDISALYPDRMVSRGVSMLKIVDVFGFEDLTRNSLDQLCINYLSEKLYAREERVILAAYNQEAVVVSGVRLSDESKGVLNLYEHSLGVFASLEELTLLHQGENENTEQEQKRNALFVRNIYERNPMLPDPPRVLANGRRHSALRVNAMPFVIPHTRGDVIYDAADFVKQNSDFVYANLLSGLSASSNPQFREILTSNDVFSTFADNSGKDGADSRTFLGKSFVSQFRSQVAALTSGEEAHMPFYFHCIRPNAKKQPSILNMDLVIQQIRSQRITNQVGVCSDISSYSAMNISKDLVISRYGRLLRKDIAKSTVLDDDAALAKQLADLVRTTEFLPPAVDVRTSGIVRFRSIGFVERLERLLEEREAQAAAKIQALFLMAMWRHRFLVKKRERRGLSNELLAWYGPEKRDTVNKLLQKYNGREDELRSKLELKKQAKLQEKRSVHQLATSLRSLCLGNHGGLDIQAVNAILHDETMKQLLQQNEKIVLALRDMSLNPDLLDSQLADHELRQFYQNLVEFLQAKKKDTRIQETVVETGKLAQNSLEERVAAATASENDRRRWSEVAKDADWSAHHEALVEVGEDPELLLFHSEDDDFVATLERFLMALSIEKERREEHKALAAITKLALPAAIDDEETDNYPMVGLREEDAEMLELLGCVKFAPSLMTAMNQDAYFVEALKDPTLMGCMQQLMANRENFVSSTALQQPAVREFFLKLIALSLAVEEQSDEE